MNFRFSKVVWGFFFLGLAALLIVNQLQGVACFGIGSIILTVLALAIIVHCVSQLQFGLLPVPAAMLYIVFGAFLGLPEISTWALLIAAVLASIGLSTIFPRRNFCCGPAFFHFGSRKKKQKISAEEVKDDNNPYVSVHLGAISRNLFADNLESAQLDCHLGSLEVYFDRVTLSPNGAVVNLNCKCGAIQLYIPRSWHVIDKTSCAIGEVDVQDCFAAAAENVPKLTLTGTVSMGSLEVRGI